MIRQPVNNGIFAVPVQQEEQEQGEEEEDDDDEIPRPTDLLCLGCMEPIAIDEDAALMQLVEPFWDEATSKIRYMVLFDENGEPKLEPIFFDWHCYEEAAEEVKQMDEDSPPREEMGSALTCDFCQSSIRMGEKCLTLETGEIIESKRLSSVSFLASGDPYVLCLTCGQGMLGASGVEDFGTALSQNGECTDCTRATCWRRGRCMCRCHYEDK